jgi:magnesium transporter
MAKMERTNILQLNEEEKEFLHDLIVDNSQALEMANIYTNILSSTLDAFASIIANNQNEVLKRLTTLTLILTVPVLIASIYGMNTPIPYRDSPYTFWIPVIISFIILLVASWNYYKRIRKTKIK